MTKRLSFGYPYRFKIKGWEGALLCSKKKKLKVLRPSAFLLSACVLSLSQVAFSRVRAHFPLSTIP